LDQVNEGGYYTVYINDANDCGSGNSVAISYLYIDGVEKVIIPSAIVISPNPAAHTDVCQGQSNGTITVSAKGGTGTLYFSRISGGNGTYQTDSVFSGLSSGNYEIWVQDGNGCKEQGSNVSIAELPLPTPSISADRTTVTCTNPTATLNSFWRSLV
jgi:hypothetical protein